MSIRDFTEHEEDMLRYALAGFLKISPRMVRIVERQEGSVRLMLELPEHCVLRLLELQASGDGALQGHLALFPIRELKQDENEVKLLTLAEISERTGISYPTLARYLKNYADQIPHHGVGRSRRYYEHAVRVFTQIHSSQMGQRLPAKDREITLHNRLERLERTQELLARQIEEMERLVGLRDKGDRKRTY